MSDDSDLLQAWRDGDRAAGEQLVFRYFDAIERFFETKAGADAEDLVQRTFLRCHEAAGAWRGTGSVRAFLFGIARNVLFEHIRGRVRDGRGGPDFEERSIVDLQPGVATEAARRADQRILLRALQTLPLESQVMLELFYWEDVSVAELAVVLEVAEGTVKSRMHRARQQLRDAVDRLPADEGDESVRIMLARWLDGLKQE